MAPRYSIDTSAILDGWTRYYPPDVFPTLWANLGRLISGGDLRAIEEVREEIRRKKDDLHDWVEERPELFVPLDRQVQRLVRVILKNHPKLIDTRRGRSGADPWVIALALVHDCAVVTAERPTGRDDRPNIPDVCAAHDVECITLLELLRNEGWRL